MLRVLNEMFPDGEFEFENPLFEFDTPDGSCIPDFLVRVRHCDD